MDDFMDAGIVPHIQTHYALRTDEDKENAYKLG
jgi:hypothetical protein